MDGYFNEFMQIARPDMNKTLMRYMRDILVAIIEEASSLPAGVMDCIIGQFEMYASVSISNEANESCDCLTDSMARNLKRRRSSSRSTFVMKLLIS